MDARIVRQVVRDGLISVAEIAGAERRVHHLHRRLLSPLRRPILGLERQRVLNVGDIFLKRGQLAALLLVANEHCCAIRRFHAEEIIEIGFVGSEDDVEFRILQPYPRQIALVVVVVEQSIGAHAKKFRECFVVARLRRAA